MVGEKILSFSEIESTNQFARENLDKLPYGTVIWSLRQRHGYGRFGRNWISDNGGLWFSVVFKPSLLSEPNIYTKLLSVAVVESIQELGYKNSRIKWPNDILIERKKVAGILTETVFSGTRLRGIVVGVGLNVNNRLPEALLESATTLSSTKNEYIPLGMILEKILHRTEILRKKYLIRGKTKYLTRKWRNHLAFIEGDEITVSLDENTKVRGIINRISPSSLQLQLESGEIHTISSGEIIL